MTLHDSADVAVDLSELALDVAGQARSDDMVIRITQLAAKIIDCAAVDLIRITGGGQLRVTASSDPGLSHLTQRAWRQWPHTTMPADHTPEDMSMRLQRSSYMQQLRADTGVVQELILPLRAGPTQHGYLRFLFTEPIAATADRRLLTAFCAHAAIALDRAALITQVEHLTLALESNREIGAAVGVLMGRHHLTYADALQQLTATSQNTNRKLRDIAADVVYTGRLPLHLVGPTARR